MLKTTIKKELQKIPVLSGFLNPEMGKSTIKNKTEKNPVIHFSD